jgi:hypothetical protein
MTKLVLCLLLLSPIFTNAESPQKAKLVSVSLFKNGLGFVTLETKVSEGKNTVLIPTLSQAVHGTFWVNSPKGTISDIIAQESEQPNRVEAISLSELIEANVGKALEIRTDKEVIKGTILSVPQNRDVPQNPNPYDARGQQAIASIVLIKTDAGVIAINKTDVRQIAASGGNLATTLSGKTIALTISSKESKDISIQHLTRGIAWAPSSVIDISNATNAVLSAKAEIINDLEDLEDVSVNFVTGFPNLQFSEVYDPLSLNGNLVSFLASLNRPRTTDFNVVTSNVVAQQSMYVNRDEATALPPYPIVSNEGQTQDELFFYEQKNVKLKKGERGSYHLYTIEVPYDQIYEWSIPDTLNDQEIWQQNPENARKAEEIIWHSLLLTNKGNIPWTTSPAMIVKSGQVLGQDLIYYTSPGSKTTVRITRALDVSSDQAEYETDRVRNSLNTHGSNYDLVTIKGILNVANYKNTDIRLKITKNLSGDVLQTQPVAKIEKIAKGLKSVNTKNVLTWELPLKSRDKLQIEYQYKVYVRN